MTVLFKNMQTSLKKYRQGKGNNQIKQYKQKSHIKRWFLESQAKNIFSLKIQYFIFQDYNKNNIIISMLKSQVQVPQVVVHSKSRILESFWPPPFFSTPNFINYSPLPPLLYLKFWRIFSALIFKIHGLSYSYHCKNTLFYHLKVICTIYVQKGSIVCCRRQF